MKVIEIVAVVVVMFLIAYYLDPYHGKRRHRHKHKSLSQALSCTDLGGFDPADPHKEP
jgi:hypothetical protein